MQVAPLTPGVLVPEILWSVLVLLWLICLVLIVQHFEFDLRFESLFHRLRPGDLRDPAYIECFGDLLNYRRVTSAGKWYRWGSVGLIVVPATVSAYSTFLGPVASVLCPAGLNAWLSDSSTAPAEHFFRHVFFWGVALHLFPLISVISVARARGRDERSEQGNAAITLLSAIFLVQQYFLDMIVGHLLRCRLNPHTARPIRGGHGSVIHLAKSRIAEAMRLTTDAEVIRREYALVTDAVIPGLGVGAAAVQGRMLSPPDERGMLVAMIERFGIPDVRQRLGWRLERRTHREKFTAPIVAEVIMPGGQRADVGNAWLVDLGSSSAHGKWNSFLMRLQDSSTRDVIQRHGAVRILSIDGKPVGKTGIESLVRRVETAVEVGCERLYVGSVVQMPQVGRFNSLIRRTRSSTEEA
jgi:hypothetical protein